MADGLNAAYAAFFSGPRGGSGAGSGTGSGGGTVTIGRETFKVKSVNITQKSGGDFYVTLQKPLANAGPLALEGAVTAAIGHRTYLLAKGIGILTDPTRISFTAARLRTQMKLSNTLRIADLPGQSWLDPAQLKLSASLGLEAAYVRTHFKSALIDRPATTKTLKPVGGLSAEIRWQRPAGAVPVLRGSLDIGADRTIATALGFGWQF